MNGEIASREEAQHESDSRQGMTQGELAQLLGVGRSNIAKWEAGVHKPHADTLVRLSKIMQGSLDEILGKWNG